MMSQDGQFSGVGGVFDEAGWRKRFAEVSDEKLIEYGKACRRQAIRKSVRRMARHETSTQRNIWCCVLRSGGE
jgi:hypothetical protein